MRHDVARAIVCAMCASVALVAADTTRAGQANGAGAQKAPKRTVVSPDLITIPGGVDGVFAASQTVVVGHVVGAPKTRKEVVLAGDEGKHVPRVVEPRTISSVEVIEVLKDGTGGELRVGRRIEIEQTVGEVDDGDRVIEFDRSVEDSIKPGARYVLFLAGTSVSNPFRLVSGRQSMMLLSGGRAVHFHESMSLPTGSEGELLSRLRKLGSSPKR
jgi:hypothetical protein